jgi:hypothetical protein
MGEIATSVTMVDDGKCRYGRLVRNLGTSDYMMFTSHKKNFPEHINFNTLVLDGK